MYSRAEFACWVGLLGRTFTLLGVGPHLRLLGMGSPSPLHISRHLVAGPKLKTVVVRSS